MKRYQPLAVASLALLVGVSGLAACGSDKKASSSTEAESSAETYVEVPASVVTKGLGDTTALLTQLAASATTVSQTQLDQVEAGWKSYEGTVKKNDPDAYLAFEDALAAFDQAAKDKDATKMAAAAKDFSDTAAAYLAKFPA